jgi:acyl-CoA thioesterase-1
MILAAVLALSAVSADAAPLNIVAIGGSNTRGFGVGMHNAFPARLQAILRANGVEAHVKNAGVIASTTADMLRRLDREVPASTHIVVLQPGTNDRRFGRTEQQRADTIEAIVARLRERRVRVIVYDQPMPRSLLQWDGVHFTIAAHDMIAKTLAAQILGGRSP